MEKNRYETTVTLTLSVVATTEGQAREKVDAAMSKLDTMTLVRDVRVRYVDGGYDYDCMEVVA